MKPLHSCHRWIACALLLAAPAAVLAQAPATSGLLFYLSGDGPGDGFTADQAHGVGEAEYLADYRLVSDGARGKAFSGAHTETKNMAYLAPGNIYAERGTLAFFWRAREPLGTSPFKIFYVSQCDQSSLDMTWARVDYNGAGFDAFVTDVNMARIRVSHTVRALPAADKWTHIAMSWDETAGVRLYLDGALVARNDTPAILSSCLGLFTPHGRFATPGTVTSNSGHLRGGDIDEIAIYDRMLSDEQVRTLASGTLLPPLASFDRPLDAPRVRDEWWSRFGWTSGQRPLVLDSRDTTVRKVEIHDARDLKKWTWRANDGIRETSWPDVYNRSHLPGRTDYFIEPDWYRYSTSGRAITFTMPDEPWNYLEVVGAAHGRVTRLFRHAETQREAEQVLFDRPAGRDRTFHLLGATFSGGRVRFDNTIADTPLGEFMAHHVAPGLVPAAVHTMTYVLTSQTGHRDRSLDELTTWITRRYPADERQVMLALPLGAPRRPASAPAAPHALPFVHVLVPGSFRNDGSRTPDNAYGGFFHELANLPFALDGIAIDLPALHLAPTHGEHIALNLQVKDPIWPNRNMLDFSFAVTPGEARTLWLDLRDRVLPNGRSLYLTLAGAGGDFGPAALEGTRLRLIFKTREAAIAEQEIDRFTQVRDNFGANLSETRPQKMKLEWYARFYRDIEDLFQVSPNHLPGRYYWQWYDPETGTLPFEQPTPPEGVPLWAFRQTEIVRQWRYFINWWIDQRQIDNGEFGGGLSDDGDFANAIPPLALLGVDVAKITDSMHRLLDAYYANGMFTNGLNTIVTDALHVSEEGTNVQSELMLLEYGDPALVERMLETSKRYTDVTKVNKAGHRHFPSRFYSSTYLADEEPWSWSSRSSYTVLHPGMTLVEFNGHPAVKQLICEVADGYLAHATTDATGQTSIPGEINFLTDEGRSIVFRDGMPGPRVAAEVFEVAHRWTGDAKYLAPLGGGPRRGDRASTDRTRLADEYAETIRYNAQRMYMGTEGFPWDDGPYISYGRVLEDRLGGVPIARGNQFPRHFISWAFDRPHAAESMAFLVPQPTSSSMTVIAYNLLNDPIEGRMTGWDVEPGTWLVTEGVDDNGDDVADRVTGTRTVRFARTGEIPFTFPARTNLVIQLRLQERATPYWSRPDLGIGAGDVAVKDGKVLVTVHSLGAVDAPASSVSLVDVSGAVIATGVVPALKAPLDFVPKTAVVSLAAPRGRALGGSRVIIDRDETLTEITRRNNVAIVP